MDAVVSKRTLGKLYSAFAKKVAKMKNHEVYGQNPNCEKWNCLIKDNLILEVLSQYKRKCVTTQAEECYIGESINTTSVLSEAFNYTETVGGSEEIPCIGANLVGGVVLNFSAITLFSVSYISSTSTILPINPIFNQDNEAYFQTLEVGDKIHVNDINNVNNYGIYEITNINPVLGPNATYRFTVTFLEGSGTFGSVGRTYNNCEQYTVQFEEISVIPGFETKTIFQFNEPEGDQNVLASDFDGITDLTSLSYDCGDYEFPTTGLFIGDLVYWDGNTNEYTLTPTEFFIGFTIKDSEGVEIELDVACDINICVDTTSTTEVFNDNKELTQEDIDCLICKI